MTARESAYATLGLRPGADRVRIDEAYRRLIKLYHPDRTGGDGKRAAEINRAYRELRDLRPEPQPIRMRSGPPPASRRHFRPSRILIGALVVGATILLSARLEIRPAHFPIVAELPLIGDSGSNTATGLVSPLDNFDEPLSNSVINRSVADALRLYREGNLNNVASYSSACQSQFRNHPSIVWFDSCAAYDEAVALLQARDPQADSGPFNPAAVTTREMSAARLLSDDSLAADSRVHQIRTRVEFVLLPQLPQAAVEDAGVGNAD